jgi:cell wall-associated NlpC family hydrolase
MDTQQLSGGAYDPATQQMVYRVLTPMWTTNLPTSETFVWTQAQWVGVPLDEGGNGRRAVPAYSEGKATDTVDVTIGSDGSMFIAKKVTPNAQSGANADTRTGASSSVQPNAQRPQRRDRRAIEALRREAQRRLMAVRRADKGKKSNKVSASAKRSLSLKPNLPTESLNALDEEVSIDLEVDGLAEETAPPPNEEDPGASIGVNGDDDNNNFIPDKDETEPYVENENNLVLVNVNCTLTIPINNETEPVLRRLTLESGAGNTDVKFKIWTASTKGSELTLPHTWQVEGTIFPIVLYIEGIKPSRSFQDARLILTYTATAQDGTVLHRLTDEVFLTVFQAKLESSSPHHVVYRHPAALLGPPPVVEPVIAASNTGPEDPPGEDTVNSGDENPELDHSPGTSPQTGEPDPPAPPIVIDPGPTDNRIDFSVSLIHCSRWRAVVNVYPVGQTVAVGSYTTPLYSAGVTQESVSWDEIFPGEKPPSGIYTYNILVYGFVEFPEIAYFEDNESGDMRLNGKYAIQNMQVVIQNDHPETGELTLGISFDIENTRGTSLEVADVKVRIVNPRLEEQPQPLSVDQNQQGGVMHCSTMWNLIADTPEELGTWSFVADVEMAEEGEQRTVPEAAGNRTTEYEVTGVVLGFRLFEDAQMERPAERTHETYADYYVLFRTFLRVNRHGQGARWYSSDSVTAEQMTRYDWIGQWAPNGLPQEADRLPDDARSEGSLNPSVQWRQFADVVRCQADHPGSDRQERWYGMNGPTTAGNGFTYSRQVPKGTTWWGGKVEWNWQQNGADGNTVVHRMVYLLPTDRRNGHQRIRLGDGDLEEHPENNTWEERSRATNAPNTAFNWVQVGPGGGTRQKLWLPDPSHEPTPNEPIVWKGRISGRLRWTAVTFADDDPFFNQYPEPERAARRQAQGDFQKRIMERAHSFLNVPYSWGGQTYGGRQSADSEKFTCTKDTDPRPDITSWHRVDVVHTIGSSSSGSGYGIDCSGFVGEVAHREQLGNGDMGASTMRSTSLAWPPAQYDNEGRLLPIGMDWRYLRAGDFMASGGHVVYVETAAFNPTTGNLDWVNAIEADPRVVDNERGRVRHREWNANELIDIYIPRRWIAP